MMAQALPAPFTYTKLELKEFNAVASLKEKYPYFVAGYDKIKRPVIVIQSGMIDLNGAISSFGADIVRMYQEQMIYRITGDAGWIDTSRGVQIINDMNGFNASMLTSPAAVRHGIQSLNLLEVSLDLEKSTAVCINVNFMAEKLITLLKPLTKNVIKQTEFFGTNPTKYNSRLVELVAKDQLPPEYGGSPGWEALKRP